MPGRDPTFVVQHVVSAREAVKSARRNEPEYTIRREVRLAARIWWCDGSGKMALLIKNSLERIRSFQESHILSRLQTTSDSNGTDVTGMWSSSQSCWRSLPFRTLSFPALNDLMLRRGYHGEALLSWLCTVELDLPLLVQSTPPCEVF